jgi:hypothetical protein
MDMVEREPKWERTNKKAQLYLSTFCLKNVALMDGAHLSSNQLEISIVEQKRGRGDGGSTREERVAKASQFLFVLPYKDKNTERFAFCLSYGSCPFSHSCNPPHPWTLIWHDFLQHFMRLNCRHQDIGDTETRTRAIFLYLPQREKWLDKANNNWDA